MVKVSIIIPVYNPGKLFEKCIDSALNQTLKDIEVICINDGSIDGSIDILNENTDFRLKIFNQKNQGVSEFDLIVEHESCEERDIGEDSTVGDHRQGMWRLPKEPANLPRSAEE